MSATRSPNCSFRRRLVLITSCVVLAVGAGTSPPARGQEAAPRFIVGQPYPNFVLPRIDNGSALGLSDLRGRKTLVLHFASW